MLHSARTSAVIQYGPLCLVLSVLLAVPTVAHAQAVPKYAKVYSARVGLNPAATLADLEALARKTGSVELLTLPASGDPCEPVKRELVRFGDPVAGYPGFAVRSTAFLAAQRAAGRAVAVAGTTTTRATVAVAGTPVDFTWARPAQAGDPASVELAAAGAVIARNVFHPVAGAADPFTRPRVIHVVGMDQGSDIVQVFEYFDKRPEVKLEPPASFLPLDPDASGETLGSYSLTGEASQAVLTDPVNFGSPTRGWPGFHFDTGWLPGGSLCARVLQGRVFANAAAGIGAHVDGDFRLDTNASTLRPGSGRGDVSIDLGFDAGGQGSLCVNLPWPIPDIDWQFTLAGVDARVNDTTTFNSFLLNGCAEARDSKSVPAVCALPPIPIPGLSGNACLTLGGSAAFQMCGDNISVSDGNTFTSEGQSRNVSISCSGYHRTANYNESGTVTAGIVVGLFLGFDITIWSWSWEPSYTFDVLSLNAPNLNFSSSGLDFNGDSCGNGVCDCGETYNSCPSDCDPTCGNGVTEVGEECDPPGSACPNGTMCQSDCTCKIIVRADTCQIAVAPGTATDPCADSVPTGPLGSCTSGDGVLDTWYSFVAIAASARIRTDLNSNGTDSDYVVYHSSDGTCAGTFTEVGCSEDESGYLGDIAIEKLVVGDTYYVQLGSWSDSCSGGYVVDVIQPSDGGICGNNVIDAFGEDCDGTDDDACPNLCSPTCNCGPSVCGNNITEGIEECDGTDADACILGCEADCTCERITTPALPIWGIAGLALLLLLGGAFAFRRRAIGARL